MRSVKAKDFWKKIYSKQYINFIDSLTFIECNGLLN